MVTERGHTTNLVGIPTGLLANPAYNDYPVRLHIHGVWESNRGLWDLLNRASSPLEAAERYQDYMAVVFGLNPEQAAGTAPCGRRRFKSSYLRLLRGWNFDANGPEGAVLKGWVESRFGLYPTFHKEPLRSFASRTWIAYVEEKMSSRFHNNSIYPQLDLLYEFCQWAFPRFFTGSSRHLTLYRGVNDFHEHEILQRLSRREAVVRQNNLVSFTSRREIADEFGDYILETRVPVYKILFFNELLPEHPLKCESEYLVIGGDYRVTVSYW
ncbi:MAG: NAD(+)--dinitrogen-reductase ADP-D-ribosyltransferase [Nitrospirae bacterium]|nr:NAD(+)--dinitrogen-reductase ADP-D-ribosyltransferase [Nitrospirota bacterium]